MPMTLYFLFAVSVLFLFFSVLGIRAVARKSAFTQQSAAARFCMLFVTGALALGALTGCGGLVLSGNEWRGGRPPYNAATPNFSPAAGFYPSAQTVTIGDLLSGETIYYTIDGTTPTLQSSVYSAPIHVAANEVIEALAVEPGGTDGVIGSADYIIGSSSSPSNAPAKIESCNGGILPPGSVDTDLQIDGVSCVVDGKVDTGTYVYRNVNIWGGGSLNFADTKIDFHAHSILVENGGSLIAGGSAVESAPCPYPLCRRSRQRRIFCPGHRPVL